MPMQAPPQQSTSTDLGFIMALAEDPFKALTMATTPAEVKQAQEAIRLMKQVCKIKTYYMTKLTHPTNREPKLKVTSNTSSNLLGPIIIPTRISCTSSSIPFPPSPYAYSLPQTRPGTTQFQTPASRTQGFKPSSARGRGRGRGAATTGRQTSAPPAPTTISLADNEDEVDQECSTSEDDEDISDMAQIRKEVAKKSQQAGVNHEGEVVHLNQTIEEDAARYPDMEPAPQMTMMDVMPAGKTPNTNPAMVVNMQADKNHIEFILTQRTMALKGGKQKGISLPNHEVFCRIIAQAINDLINQKPEWMRLVKGAKFNQFGIGVFRLKYGDKEGCEMFRNLIRTRSTHTEQFETWPACDIIRANGISIYLHAGFQPIHVKNIGISLKGCNPDMEGSFKLVNCRTLTAEGRQECQVISLDCSAEFLEWLATKPKNYRFGFLYSYLYINGGKRSDSITQYQTSALSPEASSLMHQWKGGEVMKTAFRAWGIPQAFDSSTRLVYKYICFLAKSKLTILKVKNY